VGREALASGEPPGTVLPQWLEEILARHVRTGYDELGSFYAWLEGRYGGETLLLWAPREWGEAVIRALRGLEYKGRIVLGLDASGGHGTPFQRALEWVRPRRALILTEGEGVGSSFTPTGPDPNDDTEAIEVEAPTGLRYREVPTRRAWKGELEADLPQIPGPALGVHGWERGIPTYGVGLVGLDRTLQALLRAWRLNV
jgi:hypothetical protein